jgi:hypothetical protein
MLKEQKIYNFKKMISFVPKIVQNLTILVFLFWEECNEPKNGGNFAAPTPQVPN